MLHVARILAAATVAAALALPTAASAQEPVPARQAAALDRAGVEEIIVGRDAGLDAAERRAIRAAVDGTLLDTLPLPATEVIRVPDGTLAAALAELRARPDVRFAEPDAPVRAAADRWFGLQWGLHNTGQQLFPGEPAGVPGADIAALAAWATSTGAGVTVGVVDTGVQLAHPDLAANLVGNPGERGGGREANGADDDGNGYVDDWRGWDFVMGAGEGDATPGQDGDADDGDGHGTHVAGTIAAVRDNAGVAGAAPGARVVPLRALGVDGSGTLSAIARAFDYAGDLGLPVVNASLSSDWPSTALRLAIAEHPGTLYVVAAGNGGADGIGDDVDAAPTYPCATPAPNVLCVGATDNRDARASFSNFGTQGVDLFAPGVDVLSTFPTTDPTCGGYCYLSGTSMAAPHAAAVAAIVAAAHPALRGDALKQALMRGVDPVAGLTGLAVTSGRLDAVGALAAAAAVDPTPVAAPEPAAPIATPAPATPAPAVPAPTTPAPATPAPTAPSTPATPAPAQPAPATPAPPSSHRRLASLDAPLLTAVRLPRRTLRGGASVALAVTADRAARLVVTLRRRGARDVAVRLRRAIPRGTTRVAIARRIGHVRLARGTYAVAVVATASGRRAQETLTLRVA